MAMTRHFGRAPRGERVHDAVPKNQGKHITLLGALSCRGIEAVMSIDGPTDTAVFRVDVEQVLVPPYSPWGRGRHGPLGRPQGQRNWHRH